MKRVITGFTLESIEYYNNYVNLLCSTGDHFFKIKASYKELNNILQKHKLFFLSLKTITSD